MMQRLNTLRAFFRPLAAALMLSVVLTPALSYAVFENNTGTEADNSLETKNAEGQNVTCEDVEIGGTRATGVFLGKIVPCMFFTIQESTVIFAEKMVKWLEPLYYAFLTFVIVMFGLRVLQGEPEIHKHGFVLLIKIAIVSLVLADLGNIRSFTGTPGDGEIIPAVYAVMADSQEIVVGALEQDGGLETKLTCKVQDYMGEGSSKLWAVMDCLSGKIFGFEKGDYNSGKMLLLTSLFGLLAGFFFGGPWGVVIAFAMIGVVIAIFMLMVRTVLAFANSYLVVCVLLILAPLLLPLAFLRATAPYYDKVIKNILASFLTPIVFTAFVMLALMLYDKALFAPTSILQKLFEYDKIKEALEPAQKACDRQVTVDPVSARLSTDEPAQADMNRLFMNPFLQNIVMPTLSGANDPCAMAKFPKFNVDKVDDPEYKQGKQTFEKIFKDLMKIVIIAYLINQALGALPGLISQLAAGGGAAFHTLSSGATLQSEASSKGMDAMRSGFGAADRSMRTASGEYMSGRELADRSSSLAGVSAAGRIDPASAAAREAFMNRFRDKKK